MLLQFYFDPCVSEYVCNLLGILKIADSIGVHKQYFYFISLKWIYFGDLRGSTKAFWLYLSTFSTCKWFLLPAIYTSSHSKWAWLQEFLNHTWCAFASQVFHGIYNYDLTMNSSDIILCLQPIKFLSDIWNIVYCCKRH